MALRSFEIDEPSLDVHRHEPNTRAVADVERSLDFYKALGFPTEMFTVLFALGRLPGWIAQWREMIEDPQTKIGRPRQVYTGPNERDYTPVTSR